MFHDGLGLNNLLSSSFICWNPDSYFPQTASVTWKFLLNWLLASLWLKIANSSFSNSFRTEMFVWGFFFFFLWKNSKPVFFSWAEGAHWGAGHQTSLPASPHVRRATQTHPEALRQAARLRQLQGASRSPQGPPRARRAAGGPQQLRGTERPTSGWAEEVQHRGGGAVQRLRERLRSGPEGLHEADAERAEAPAAGSKQFYGCWLDWLWAVKQGNRQIKIPVETINKY